MFLSNIFQTYKALMFSECKSPEHGIQNFIYWSCHIFVPRLVSCEYDWCLYTTYKISTSINWCIVNKLCIFHMLPQYIYKVLVLDLWLSYMAFAQVLHIDYCMSVPSLHGESTDSLIKFYSLSWRVPITTSYLLLCTHCMSKGYYMSDLNISYKLQ